jgi:hypothetical protein
MVRLSCAWETEGPHAGVGQATAQASSRPIISNSPWAPAELGQPDFDWLVARPPLPALRLAHLASRLQKSTGFSENQLKPMESDRSEFKNRRIHYFIFLKKIKISKIYVKKINRILRLLMKRFL